MEYVPDDVAVPVVSYRVKAKEVREEELDYSMIKEQGVNAQRLVVSRLVNKHVKGTMEVAMPDSGRKLTSEKMFNIPKLVEWVEGDPVVVVDALMQGRLRCRLSARMGLGKSTKLASYVAKAMDFRVLHVTLNAQALQQAAIFIKGAGIGKYDRRWSATKRKALCGMTYADFNGHMATSKRADLFKAFELIIFDEGFYNSGDVFVAKRCFAVYAPADTNLIVCSATIRSDKVGDETGSGAMGSFREMSRNVTLDEALSSGKLVAEYLVDRSIVFLPTNDAIYMLAEAYENSGVDVKTLDDAASYEDLREVETWMQGDSATPRVVVANPSYGIAFNISVSYGIVFPFESVVVVGERTVETKLVPMSSEMVTQCKARTGRGLVDGSGGIIMSSERMDGVDLQPTDKMMAFTKLCAASIKPLRNEFWKDQFDLFPEGMTVGMAQMLLKVCLPIEVTARYMAQDARIARKYCRALNAYSHPDHFLLASDYEEPIGLEDWLDEDLCCMDGDSVNVKVPFSTSGELQIILHSIELIAQGKIEVPRWRPQRLFAMDDAYDSEEEMNDSRYKKRPALTLRRIDDNKPLPSIPVPQIQAVPWSYRALEGSDGLRRGGYIDSDRCREALEALELQLLEYSQPELKVEQVVETVNGSEMPIVLGDGNVESPGGSIICSLPVGLCEKMNLGQELVPTEVERVISAAKKDITRFAQSKLFDCFGGPWDSLLKSLLQRDVVNWIVKRGLPSDTYALVDSLRGRFSTELCSVLSQSNVFHRTFFGMFKVIPSVDKVMRAIRTGRFDGIAQTKAFINRVKDLKTLIDTVLLEAETQNVYLPTYITSAQRALPLRGDKVVGYVGDDLTSMPGSWQASINGSVVKEEKFFRKKDRNF